VIYVGDASMADSELFRMGGNVLFERSNALPGIEWLKRMKRRYRRSVWLNPISKEEVGTPVRRGDYPGSERSLPDVRADRQRFRQRHQEAAIRALIRAVAY